MWRETLSRQELEAVSQAQPGSLVRKLADLLDQQEAGAVPKRGQLARLAKPHVPSRWVRLDETQGE